MVKTEELFPTLDQAETKPAKNEKKAPAKKAEESVQ
jgi:hypothetical protein